MELNMNEMEQANGGGISEIFQAMSMTDKYSCHRRHLQPGLINVQVLLQSRYGKRKAEGQPVKTEKNTSIPFVFNG